LHEIGDEIGVHLDGRAALEQGQRVHAARQVFIVTVAWTSVNKEIERRKSKEK
jgi:hypothetical protein